MRTGIGNAQDLMGIVNGAACNLSVYSNGNTETKIKFAYETGEPLTGDIDIIGYRDPSTGYFTGVPLSEPITPASSGSNDRYIGNDYNNSGIDIDVTKVSPFMHLENWSVSFYINSSIDAPYKKIYGEGSSLSDVPFNVIETAFSDTSKIRIYCKDVLNNQVIPAVECPISIIDGSTHHVKIERISNILKFTVDGVVAIGTSSLSLSGDELDQTTIGGLRKQTVDDLTFTGKIWDFDLNGIIIPIDEGSGTDIYDSSDTLVGTLVDPLSAFWDYSISTWKLLEDKPCNNNNLLLDDDNIALQDDDGAFLFGD